MYDTNCPQIMCAKYYMSLGACFKKFHLVHVGACL